MIRHFVHAVMSSQKTLYDLFQPSAMKSSTGQKGKLAFSGLSTLPPSFFIVIHYLPSRFSTGLSVQFDRGWGRVFLVSGACGWVSSRVGSWVF